MRNTGRGRVPIPDPPAQSTRPPLSPVAVRSDFPDPEHRLLNLAAELSPVILIMDRKGITAAGFMITSAREVDINHHHPYDRVAAEKLAVARDAIREEAKNTIGLYAIPDAMIIFGLDAVGLFGDERSGQLWSLPDGVRMTRAES